ncbi:MAG: 4Fe-4S dicluster domain-containing protein [Bacteroidota bacterium]
MAYFKNIKDSIKTLSRGLAVTLRHVKESRKSSEQVGINEASYFDSFETGINTLQYPHESIPVPDNGRYKLHNEIDDCIVCDKCAKVCPVDCIDIEGIRATEVIGKTSDGTSKRIYAAKFDIDMAKCCFCGLCTTVCPTECLTMTKSYDFSTYDFEDHTYSFANMTPLEILEKKKMLEEHERKKAGRYEVDKVKPTLKPNISTKPGVKPLAPKTVFKPRAIINKKDGDEGIQVKKIKPVVKPESTDKDQAKPKASKPVFKPRPIIKKKDKGEDENPQNRKIKPVIKLKGEDKNQEQTEPKEFKPRPIIIKRKNKDD